MIGFSVVGMARMREIYVVNSCFYVYGVSRDQRALFDSLLSGVSEHGNKTLCVTAS